MKKISILLAVVAFMISCTPGTSYKISGTVENPEFNGTYVFIQEANGRNLENLDSALVEEGKFVFQGDALETKVRFISLDSKVEGRKMSQIVLEPGQIKVEVTADKLNITGTTLNDALSLHNAEVAEKQKAIMEISKQFQTAGQDSTMTDELREELIGKYEAISAEINASTATFIKTNIANALGKSMFLSNINSFEMEQQEELIALADESFKAEESVQKIIQRIENAKKVAIGQKFVDFTMKNVEGNDISLSEYAGKGNVVLIDFWAAWCGPCRQEMPNVVDAYKEFKTKGFEVIGVSLDRDQESWEKGLKDLNMTWPQMSDLKFWESPVVSLYAINGIPHTVLIDGEGNIIAKDLRGKALHYKLAELLNK